ncbi:MAG: hypothetical protein WD032_06000 [Nitrospirales bacterium]
MVCVWLLLLVYPALALPLPMVLLDHELGLLTGDPSHTAFDDHAWLDHAAGSGMASADKGAAAIDPGVQGLLPFCNSFYQSSAIDLTTARGPPVS